MKRVITYISTIILSIFFGCTLMYGIIYFFPDIAIKNFDRENKTVNVVDTGISQGIDNVYNSVVIVESFKDSNLTASGSGFAFKKDEKNTYLITNHHVISKQNLIIITLSDGTTATATLVGSDAYADIAVLKTENNDKFIIAKTESIKNIKVGDTVFAIGTPVDKSFANTVTRGILSGKDRLIPTIVSDSHEEWIMDLIQTDAAINPGNSGGPLCDINGSVIGVNTLKSSAESVGFSIPIDDALNYANSIIENGKILRGYIGISMVNANDTQQLTRNEIKVDKSVTSGVAIVEILEPSPAHNSGLKKGDVIVKINDKSIFNISEFRYNLYKYNIGQEITLAVNRSGKVQNIKVKIALAE